MRDGTYLLNRLSPGTLASFGRSFLLRGLETGRLRERACGLAGGSAALPGSVIKAGDFGDGRCRSWKRFDRRQRHA